MLKKIVFAVIVMLYAVSMTVYAEEISTSISFEVENTITGDIPETTETFTYILVSEDGEDEAQLTINGAGEGTFAEIVYTVPDMYTYELYEVKGDDSHYTYDETVYTISVYVAYHDGTDGELYTMVKVYKMDSDVKEESILFINNYEDIIEENTSTEDPSTEGSNTENPSIDANSNISTSSDATTPFWGLPQTGDKANIWWSVFMIFISIAGIVLLLVLRKKNS